MAGDSYRGAAVVRGAFATPARPQIHNGSAVADTVLGLQAQRATPSVEIFADILRRSVASDELVEEFLETDWNGVSAHLTLNHVTGTGAAVNALAEALDADFGSEGDRYRYRDVLWFSQERFGKRVNPKLGMHRKKQDLHARSSGTRSATSWNQSSRLRSCHRNIM